MFILIYDGYPSAFLFYSWCIVYNIWSSYFSILIVSFSWITVFSGSLYRIFWSNAYSHLLLIGFYHYFQCLVSLRTLTVSVYFFLAVIGVVLDIFLDGIYFSINSVSYGCLILSWYIGFRCFCSLEMQFVFLSTIS